MRAFVANKYGNPLTLSLKDNLPIPEPGKDEILIKVHATSMNPADWHRITGKPYFIRFESGLFKPNPNIIGADIAGVITKVGSAIKGYAKGDYVLGEISTGAFGEYALAKSHQIVKFTKTISMEHGAALPVAGITALQGLRDVGQIKPHMKVLINGTSGGVGTFAVQISKYYDCIVTGVCGTHNVDQTKSLGANHIIDYNYENFKVTSNKYDIVFDAVGNCSARDYENLLTPDGIGVAIGFQGMVKMLPIMFKAKKKPKKGKDKIGLITASPNPQDLAFLVQLVSENKITPIIEKVYPFKQLPKALQYNYEGHAKAKLVVMHD